MLLIQQRCEPREAQEVLVLPFERRQKSRLRARLESGNEAGIFLPPGSVLRDGDCLLADDGRVVRVVAAAEPVLTATAADWLLLMRAAYHLGNRHAPVQLGASSAPADSRAARYGLIGTGLAGPGLAGPDPDAAPTGAPRPGRAWLRTPEDAVLAGMLRQLGLEVSAGMAPFEPEAGAYAGHSHARGVIHDFAQR